MNLAVIPARGGSKRIPRKNIRDFCGKPMILWSIEAALASGCFEKIIVSTDDSEIADVARAAGADVPFLRPAELSDDHTGTIPVIRHAIEMMRAGGFSAELTCCIYATAPFLMPTDIIAGRDALLRENCDFAFAVTRYPFPIQRAISVTRDNRIKMFDPSMYSKRSQDLEESWHDAGQFYWGRSVAWLAQGDLFANNSAPIILPRHRVEDIDTEEDWSRAEWLFRAQSAQVGN